MQTSGTSPTRNSKKSMVKKGKKKTVSKKKKVDKKNVKKSQSQVFLDETKSQITLVNKKKTLNKELFYGIKPKPPKKKVAAKKKIQDALAIRFTKSVSPQKRFKRK